VPSRSGRASLDLRVPVARIQPALARLSRLGTIVAQHVAVADLQGRLDRADRRLRALRNTIVALRAELARRDLPDARAVVLRARLGRDRATLAAAQRGRAGLVHEGSYARVALALRTAAAPAHRPPAAAGSNRFGRALRSALGLLSATLVAAIYAVVLAAPLVLLAALVWLAMRAGRRRSERRLLERA
jgi:hypothetical protein